MGVHRFDWVGRALLLDAVRGIGISKPAAERIIQSMTAKAWGHALSLDDAVEAANAELAAKRALAATLECAARVLRAITHVVIKEMTPQLQ